MFVVASFTNNDYAIQDENRIAARQWIAGGKFCSHQQQPRGGLLS